MVSPSQVEIDLVFGPEEDLDLFLISKQVYPANETIERLQSEGDSTRLFHTHISKFVMLAFQNILTQRSETGPLGFTTASQTIDWTY